tara:strand:- start:5649 stop:6248 length:600 start_codon:yes stop_codon:yes gene_type:complete
MNLYNYIKSCNQCILCDNQSPVLQKCNTADVFWVGLSAVKVSDSGDIPLSNNTNSGKLINSIEFLNTEVDSYKTNLVKCLPLKDEKIRYPSKAEMKICFPHLENEMDSLNPRLIFLLGKQVATFVLNEYGVTEYSLDENFEYKSFEIGNYKFIPIHHPSFILVYKRKRLQEYIRNIESIIKSIKNIEEVIEEKHAPCIA